jgi:hypothetical protein
MQEAVTKVREIFLGPPNLIIGNYIDGNLVASLISHHLHVTQVQFLLNQP